MNSRHGIVLLALLVFLPPGPGRAGTAEITVTEVVYSPRITGSHGLAETSDGTLYICDSYGGTDAVYRIKNGTTEAVAWGFEIPAGLWIDDSGRFYICDVGANAIIRYDSDWNYDTEWAVSAPWNMVFDGSDILTVSYYGSVYRITGSGTTAIWTGLTNPFGIARDADGNIYVSEHTAGRIAKRTPEGVTSVLTGDLTQPEGIRMGPDGRLWVADTAEGALYRVTLHGDVELVDTGAANLSYAVNLTQLRDHHLYLGCAGSNGRIYRLDWIPGATPTAAPTATPAPEPTITPGATVTPTPDPGTTGVVLEMPAHYFSPGDPCCLQAHITNTGPDPLMSIWFLVVLDVYGSYFVGPDFTTGSGHRLTLPPGKTSRTVLPEFPWPENAGSASNLVFYGGLASADLSAVIGDVDVWKFSYGF